MAPTGLPRIHEIGIDFPVLLFTLAIALFSSLLFASIPIFKYAGSRLNTGLREGGRALSQSREQHRARNVLVIVQVALALVLLICSGLMIRTFRALMRVPPGFTVAGFRSNLPLLHSRSGCARYPGRTRRPHGPGSVEQARRDSGSFAK